MVLLVQEADVPKLAQIMQQQWASSVHAEGNVPVVESLRADESGELPCPACGTAAPLDLTGACTDCGLVLG
ncbi:MAG: hypothetical protein GY811_20565 [Myxococcales bacterium]|nr:hypothetical protein [Myxococcales bacterium]